MREEGSNARLVGRLDLSGQVPRIKINNIGILAAALGRISAREIPDRQRDGARDKPALGQADFVEPSQDLGE